MLMRFFKPVSAWKIVLGIFALATFIGFGLFARKVFSYYRAIQSGVADPFLEEQLQSTFSRAVANANVTKEDLARLYASNAPVFGPTNPQLTVVEFLDYDCPYSHEAYPAVREMMEKYKDRVSFVIRDFPVEELHPRAIPAASAARCAQQQGKFLPYFDNLFINQDHHQDADFERYARNSGLDVAAFQSCYGGRTQGSVIQNDVHDGLQAGVAGTPTFFFNGIKIQGALNRDQLDRLIQRFLAQAPTTK